MVFLVFLLGCSMVFLVCCQAAKAAETVVQAAVGQEIFKGVPGTGTPEARVWLEVIVREADL